MCIYAEQKSIIMHSRTFTLVNITHTLFLLFYSFYYQKTQIHKVVKCMKGKEVQAGNKCWFGKERRSSGKCSDSKRTYCSCTTLYKQNCFEAFDANCCTFITKSIKVIEKLMLGFEAWQLVSSTKVKRCLSFPNQQGATVYFICNRSRVILETWINKQCPIIFRRIHKKH